MFSLTKHKEILKYAKEHLSQKQYKKLKWAIYTNGVIIIEGPPETKEQQVKLRCMLNSNGCPATTLDKLYKIEV